MNTKLAPIKENYKLGTKIFKIDSKGKTREWSVDVEDFGSHAEIVTLAGIKDGKLVESRVPVYEGKNIGRSNETGYYEQAVSEALSSAESKLRGEYRFELNGETNTLRSGIVSPMLAEKYHPTGAQKNSRTLDKLGIRDSVVYVQPKYDGNRCLIRIKGKFIESSFFNVAKDILNSTEEDVDKKYVSVELFTRKGDRMLPVPHIENALRHAYINYMSAIDAKEDFEFILDGEIYAHGLPVATISGLIRNEKRNKEEQKLFETFKLHIYDVVDTLGYFERYNFLQNFFKYCPEECPIEITPSYPIEANEEEIDAKLMEFLEAGYEGLMIRQLETAYEHKRSKQLLKYKTFMDEEFTIVDVLEDSRGGMVGAFVMAMNEVSYDRDGKEIKTFKAGIVDLTQEQLREIFENKHLYVGKRGTVRFQCYTEYKVPFFPKLVQIRYDD